MNTVLTLIEKLESTRPFSDKEAWTLFRLAAISEAVGWSLLITGILIKRAIPSHSDVPVLLVGQIHGTIFLLYIVAVLALYPSLRWSRKRTILAGLASIPPYGSLLLEQWVAFKRRGEALKTYREITVRAIVVQKNMLLAMQLKDNVAWQLPGGTVLADETVEQALSRLVSEQTGVTPIIERLAYMQQHRRKKTHGLTLFFTVTNAADFKRQTLTEQRRASATIDELHFIDPKNSIDLRPVFLQTASVIDNIKQQHSQAIVI